MSLIEQEEAAKLIRQNKDTHEDCQAAIFYNKGCEHSAQIVEQMKGAEEVEAIPLDWIINFKNSTKVGALMGPKEVINFMLEVWREEHERVQV